MTSTLPTKTGQLQLHSAIIDQVYNVSQLHSALDHLSPQQFEGETHPASGQIRSFILSDFRVIFPEI